MKYATERLFADSEKAARRLMEHAQAFEPVQDGRIYIEKINGPFLFGDKGTPAEYSAGLEVAISRGDARIWDIREIHPNRRRAICLMADKGWSREFEDPIPLPGGRKLITLRDAADYMTALPKKEAAAPEWQAAIEALMLVAKTNGPPCSHVSASCGH